MGVLKAIKHWELSDNITMNLNHTHFRAGVIIEDGKIEEYKKLVFDKSNGRSYRTRYIKLRVYFDKGDTRCIVN